MNMCESTSLDLAAVHQKFSAKCFNDAWTLLDKADRTRDEERLMVATAMASLYHWLQRPDCTAQQLSVGYWQISRVHAVLRRGAEALHYAEICESYSAELAPFYRGYALEALARAAKLTGAEELAERSKQSAKNLLPEIIDAQEREALSGDLATV